MPLGRPEELNNLEISAEHPGNCQQAAHTSGDLPGKHGKHIDGWWTAVGSKQFPWEIWRIFFSHSVHPNNVSPSRVSYDYHDIP